MAPHVEGIYRPGQRVLVIDDLAAGGGSLVETVEGLRDAGLMVTNAVILIDREQGAARRLEAMGVKVQSILSLAVILTYLHSAGHLSREDFDRSTGYLNREGEPRSEFD
jgi:orotate phosphoribosyltransferase